MDLSPNDIRNFTFANQMRGYSREEVDGFREQVASALEALKQDHLKLTMENESLKSQLAGLKQFEDTIKNAAIDARRNADMTVDQAKREAEAVLSQAREEAEKIIQARVSKAEDIESQITKLELAKKSYLTKLRNMISNHLELIEDIATREAKQEAADNQLEVEHASEVDSRRHETITSQPTRQTPIKTEEANAAGEIVEVTQVDETGQEADEELTESLRQVVKEEQSEPAAAESDFKITEHVDQDEPAESDEQPDLMVQSGTSGIPISEQPTTEQARLSKDTPPELETPGDAAKAGVMDPELAAALEHYQKTQVDPQSETPAAPNIPAAEVPPAEVPPAPEIAPMEPIQQVSPPADTGPVDAPSGFVTNETSQPSDSGQIDTGASAEQAAAPRDANGAALDPNDLANALDSVVAKFEEEMDKADKA